MPARSKSQQRLFGMVHAYQKGKLKDAPESIKAIAGSISEEDAEHFAKTKHKGLPEKKADIDLKDGKYDDVNAVYEGLTDKEKNFVTPGRRIYKDVPKYLAGRTVAYNGDTPVGFSDIYGYNNDGSLRTSPNICLAVSGDARGKHLASIMTKDVMHKVLARAKELREEKGARADKIKRFVWMILKENYSSARAAIHSGFKEVPYRDGSQRKFIMSRRDAEKKAEDKDIVFPNDEIKGLEGRDSIVTHSVSDDAGKYDMGDIVKSPWGDRYEVSDRKDISKVDDSPYYKYLTDSQKALLKVYDRIAVLRLKRLEKKAVSFSPDGATFTLGKGESPWHAVKAWNTTNPGRKITTNQVLSANKGVKSTGYGIGKSYRTGLAAASTATPSAPVKPVATKPVQTQGSRPQGTPIGYWNNNPGNMVSDGRTEWEGIKEIVPKGKNMVFNDYGSGYRAMARLLYNYGAKHGIDTIKSTVARFAKSAPAAKKIEYENFLKSKTGWNPDGKIDLTNENTLQRLVPSMAAFEIGPKWTGKHDPGVVSNAVTRAIQVK